MNVVAPPRPLPATKRYRPAVQRGVAYARNVISGRIPACRYVRLACERFERDLALAESGRGPWRFDPGLAEMPIEFAGQLRNYKGPLAGQLIEIMPWQAFLLANLFGFVDRRTGFRRFRQGVVFVPKGNGKTALAAIIALYMTFAEGEGGAEGYSAAVNRDQAMIMFSDARQMALNCPEMLQDLEIGVNAKVLYQSTTASRMLALSSQAKSLDGKNVHIAVCDEIASHRTGAVYSALLTAIGKRSQSMLLSISTATDNIAGQGRLLWDDVVSILEGKVADDSIFGLIYTIDLPTQHDAGDDPFAETSWIKANPGWGITVIPSAIAAVSVQAQRSAAHEAEFKTKHLNVWTGALNPLFSPREWAQCRDPDLKITDMKGQECYVGVDLASRTDLAAMALVFPVRTDALKLRYRVFCQFYVNEEALKSPDAKKVAMYKQWEKDGWLTLTPGNETDFEFIEADLLAFSNWCKIVEMGVDPWNAVQFTQRAGAAGIKTIEIRQNVANMSEPTKELGAAIHSGRVAHDGNPVLAWCIGNVNGRFDANENVYPRKTPGRDENKIDGATALICAIARALVSWKGPSVYESRGVLVFG